jgi:hypothetical protein
MASNWTSQSPRLASRASAGGGPPGIVDEDVDAAFRDQPLDERLDAGEVGEVEPRRRDAPADLGRQGAGPGPDLLLAARGRDDARAFFRQRAGDRRPEAAACSQNQRPLALQSKIHRHISSWPVRPHVGAVVPAGCGAWQARAGGPCEKRLSRRAGRR